MLIVIIISGSFALPRLRELDVSASITLSIYHSDRAGNSNYSSSNFTLDKDTVAPTITVDHLDSEGNLRAINEGNQESYTFSGTCNQNQARITIAVADLEDDINASCDGVDWEIAHSFSRLTDSATSIRVTITIVDEHDNSTEIITGLIKDTESPTVTINALVEADSGNLTSYPLSGTCSEEGVEIQVSAGGAVPSTQPICQSGQWSTTVDISTLAGTIAVTANQTDSAGNLGAAVGQSIQGETVVRTFLGEKISAGSDFSCGVNRRRKC